jgi:hypothetical protein
LSYEQLNEGVKRMDENKQSLYIIIFISAIIVGLTTAWFIHLNNALNWDIHETMTAEEKTDFSCKALLPSIADCLERYGDKGLRDSEYMVESCLFSNKEEFIEGLPKSFSASIEKTLNEGVPESATDLKGVSVERYAVMYELPVATKDELDAKYEYYTYGCFINYYILKYEDGSFRFAVDIANT